MKTQILMLAIAVALVTTGTHALAGSEKSCIAAAVGGGTLPTGCFYSIQAAAIACPVNAFTGGVEPLSAIVCWGSMASASLACPLSIVAIIATILCMI